jgi:FkbM family methyltransferase
MIPEFLRPILFPLRPYYLPILCKNPMADFGEDLLVLIKPDDVVVEVGANIGGTSLKLSPIVKEVYAFEPNPYCFNILKRYARRTKNIHPFNMALTNYNGTIDLNFTRDKLRTKSSSTSAKFGGKSVKVKCSTLDDLSLKPSVVILDCEGEEVAVLEGARKTLQNVRLLVAETHWVPKETGTRPKVMELSKENGFGLVKVLEDNPYQEIDGIMHQSVLVFSK